MKQILIILALFAIPSLTIAQNRTIAGTKQAVVKQAVQATTVQIKIKGMACGGCEANVNNTLKNKEGVLDVETSHKKEQTLVQFDPEKITIAEIKQELKRKTDYSILEDKIITN